MKIKLFFLFFFTISAAAFSQQYVFGKVASEFDTALEDVVIYNVRSEEKILSDRYGNFMISAKSYDELRFIKGGFDRISVKVSAQNFSAPLNVILYKLPYDIAEVALKPQLTGNLRKDVRSLDQPAKVVALNSSLGAYMRTPSTVVAPKLSTPSAFAGHNYNAGQGTLLTLGEGGSGGLVGLVGSLVKSKNSAPTTANYAETQAFFRRVKTEIDLSFYTSQGWDEEQIDKFLIYADASYSLAKKYRKTFDVEAIKNEMKLAYQQYVKTHKTGF
ncbi:hypothetical protein SAMN05421638_1638 [Kaistella treverensis]|uniref:Carboxypeptidase-like regulatory domain-containing protein n=1 Tax=Kaistella treverensis TaxID=631455 RepID=A0A1I3MAX4_9FLAO|nr:hypothetical protein [Kaistella treverensis]SFI94133.1 hypothetical protein SAMN05421638_1638 [Kaistella treverensis]